MYLPLIHLADLTWRATPIPDPQAFAAMKAALNSGCNYWNAGEIYGTPTANSLHLLNRYFTKFPEDADKVVINIKGGVNLETMKPDGSETNIRKSIDQCLKILDGKKFLDIFEPARMDPNTPLKETMGTMAEYVKEGKIGGIGLSEVTADQIKQAAALHAIASVEVEMSVHTPDILANGVASTCAELKIPIVAYSPLGRGLLTGQMTKPSDLESTDLRHHLPRFQAGNMEKNAEMSLELQKLAKKKGCSPAQIALAWVRSFSGKPGMPTIIPIPGSTTEERAVENSEEVVLNDDDLKEIEDIAKKSAIVGERYPAHWK